MSRSRRKTPVFGITTAATDKPYKTAEHRRERCSLRSLPLGEALPPKAFGSPWKSGKDGKRYWRHAKPSDMRK